jgi:hypothetical protein
VTFSVERQLVNGVWETHVVDESGGGGSLPPGGTTGEVLTKVSDADGDADWEAGGGTDPSTLLRGVFAEPGFGTSIANGGIADLSWDDQGFAGGPVLDLSGEIGDPGSPTHPAVLTAGVYTITAEVEPFADLTVDGFFTVLIYMDTDGDSPGPVEIDSRLATVAQGSPHVSVSVTWYLAEGATFRLDVRNRDGAAERAFGITIAYVQQVA